MPRRLILTWFSLFLIVLSCFGLVAISTRVRADDDKDYSFYKVASAAAAYYDDASNAASEEEFKGDISAAHNFGKAATYLGFIDTNYDTGFFGSTVSYLSSSTQSRGYGSFSQDGLQAYVQYGYALSALGLDTVASKSFDIGAIVRLLYGCILWIAWAMALVIEHIFAVVAWLLQLLNPFRWFGSVVSSVVTLNGIAIEDTPKWMIGLQRFLSYIYTVFQEAGLALTAILFMSSLGLSLIAWKGSSNIRSNIRKFITRMVFILVGVPILGVLYTAALENMANMGSNQTYAANQIVGKYLVDFESWAQNSNLALPRGMKIRVDFDKNDLSGGSVSSYQPITTLTSAINRENTEAYGSKEELTLDEIKDSQRLGRQPLLNDIHRKKKKIDMAERGVQVRAMNDIIGRYMTSAFFHPSDYETAYKAKANVIKSNNNGNTDLAKSFKEASKIKSYQKSSNGLVDGATYLSDNANQPVSVAGNIASNYFIYTGNGGSNSDKLFSSLGMYNYLTTEFSGSSIITYSSNKVSSLFVVKAHRSVNVVGAGVASFLNLFSMVLTLFGISILAISYAFGMIFNSFGRGVKMITSIPFAMMGHFKAMAKVTIYGLMMVIEVFGTMLAYSLVIELYVQLGDVITTSLTAALRSDFKAAIVIPGVGANILVNALVGNVGIILHIIANLWFLKKAVKMRKLIVKSLDQYVAILVDRIFNSDGAAAGVASAPTAGDKMAQVGKAGLAAAGAGVGMAVGASLVGPAGASIGKQIGGAAASTATGGGSGPGGDPNGSTASNSGGSKGENTDKGGAEGFDEQKPIATGNKGVTGSKSSDKSESDAKASGRGDNPIDFKRIAVGAGMSMAGSVLNNSALSSAGSYVMADGAFDISGRNNAQVDTGGISQASVATATTVKATTKTNVKGGPKGGKRTATKTVTTTTSTVASVTKVNAGANTQGSGQMDVKRMAIGAGMAAAGSVLNNNVLSSAGAYTMAAGASGGSMPAGGTVGSTAVHHIINERREVRVTQNNKPSGGGNASRGRVNTQNRVNKVKVNRTTAVRKSTAGVGGNKPVINNRRKGTYEVEPKVISEKPADIK